MKILLLNPPFLNKYSKSSRSPGVAKSGTIYFPLWLSYAAGVLDEAGHELKIIDAPAKCWNLEKTLAEAKKFGPGLIVIDTSTPSIYSDLKCARLMKESIPDITVCLAGTHATACVEEILPRYHKFVDIIARHEYDYTLKELAETSDHGYENVKGISYVRNGELIHTPDRDYIENLDEIPFVSKVYKKYLDISDYFYAHVSYPTVSIFSSRGCPSKCFYCMYSQVMFGKCYRKRSAENLYEEMEYISVNFPMVKEVLIDDDNFAVDQDNVRRFCELMITHKNKLKWVVQVRVNLKYETMVLMKKAGCKLLVAGFESGNQKILDNMRKGITIEQSLKFDQSARKAGLRVHGCFMVGNPGETRQTMMETLAFAKKLHLDTAQFFPLMLYPGTEAYNWAKENHYMLTDNYRNWIKKDGMHNCVFETPELSAEDMVEFCNFARKKFYFRPRYILMKGMECLTSKEDLIRTSKSFITFSKYLFKKGKKF